MLKYKKLITQITLFGTVGVVTLLIDLAVTVSLYRVLNFPAYLASGIGFLSGFFFNFPVNRHKVFNHSKYDRFSLHNQVLMVVSLSLFNLIATSAIVEFIVSNKIIEIQYAKIAVTVMIAVWNFLLFKFFIFSKKS